MSSDDSYASLNKEIQRACAFRKIDAIYRGTNEEAASYGGDAASCL